MKKHVYSLIALAVIAGPLSFSFESQIHFWTHWPAVGAALAVTGILFLFWDAMVVKRGDWHFNPVYTDTRRLFGLPLGEYLFFIAVPYACLFLFEIIKLWVGSVIWFTVHPSSLYIGALVFVVAALIFRKHGYTFLALVSVAIFLSTLALTRPQLAGTSVFWIWWIVCFVAFVVVDGLYTWLPTIFYRQQATLGIRVGTIPLEDFFYNLSYLGLTLCFYLQFESWFATILPSR